MRRLGVDIGYRNCKVALVAQGREGLRVVRLASAPVPAGVWQGDRLADPDTVGALLARLAREADPDCRDAVAAVPIRAAHLRRLTLPALPPRELGQAVRWEMQRFLAHPVEELEVDYALLRPAGEGGNEGEPVEVLAAAAAAADVAAYRRALAVGGLRLLALEVEPLALWRLARCLAGEDAPGGVEVLLDVGAYRSTLLVVEGGLLHLARPLPQGGNTLTEAVARATGRSWEEAEEAKRAGGEEVRAAAAAFAEDLAAELNRSLRYFLQHHPQARLARLVLSGGGTALPDLPRALGEMLDLPVSVLDPGPLADPALVGRDLRSFAVAIGLGLRGAPSLAGPTLNLLAPRLPSASARRRRVLSLATAACLAAAGAGVILAAAAALGAGHARRAVAALASGPAVPDPDRELLAVNARLQALAPLAERGARPRLALLAVRLAPPGIALERAASAPDGVRLAGRAASVEVLAEYMKRLAREPALAPVNLEETARLANGDVRFALTAAAPAAGGAP